MIVCMYSPSAHRLTFRELCVCNGDWMGERDAGVDIARWTSCLRSKGEVVMSRGGKIPVPYVLATCIYGIKLPPHVHKCITVYTSIHAPSRQHSSED